MPTLGIKPEAVEGQPDDSDRMLAENVEQGGAARDSRLSHRLSHSSMNPKLLESVDALEDLDEDAQNQVAHFLDKMKSDASCRNSVRETIERHVSQFHPEASFEALSTGLVASLAAEGNVDRKEKIVWKQRARRAIVAGILGVIFAAAGGFSITYFANEVSKESHVDANAQLLSKDGQVVQTRNTELGIDPETGSLVQRFQVDERRRGDGHEVDQLDEGPQSPVLTTPQFSEFEWEEGAILNMTAQELDDIEMLEVEVDEGLKQSFKIAGHIAMNEDTEQYAVAFETLSTRVILIEQDGTQVLSQDDFNQHYIVGNGRRLHELGRKLYRSRPNRGRISGILVFQRRRHRRRGYSPDCDATPSCGGVGYTIPLTVHCKARCFQYYPPPSAPDGMPVIVFFHGAAERANVSCKEGDQLAEDADVLGYALVCADAYALASWQFPKTGDDEGVTSSYPQPCSASDSEDWTYVNQIFQYLSTRRPRVDMDKVYFMGFSQGAMMTAWAATCFADKIRGAAQAGSGLKLHSNAVTNQFCTASANNLCAPYDDDGVSNPYVDPAEDVCLFDTCTYFPLQPTKQENIVGEDLKWCLYMGCDDPLAHSVNHMAEYLNSRGVPNNLEKYNGEHNVPESWMTKVAECHGIFPDTIPPTDSSGVTCSSDTFFEQTR